MDSNTQDLNNYNEKCSKIIVRKEKETMIPICKKYLRFLDTSEIWRRQFTRFDFSLLLSYWLFEKLIKIYHHRNSIQIALGFSDLQAVWADFFNYSRLEETHIKNCKPEHKLVDHEDWENRKKLYDYYVDYDYLFSMAQSYHDKCDYYKKIKEMSPIYKSYEGKCPTEGHDCPKFFHKFHKEYHNHILENLPCRERIEQEIAVAAAAQAKASSPHHPEGSELEPGAPKDDHGQRGGEISTPDTEITHETTDIKTKVANSVLGAAPVLLTATMLYRYTPLGPWIRRFGGPNTNSMSAMGGVSSYTPETGDMFSDESANYISYQPM
ncbi:hypothetical protein PVMG_05530 [Plasmodium vivax Mauritania I]|uniref:Variable surface protein Vir4 n=1 Tax=Plasmodium vivax Mauritania I TaxID=1035515 RepID=A0A0J9TI49_PLAVI|nr:hypothetical protein PVMG_05530 [Plasmodium vivax Mauritania I]